MRAAIHTRYGGPEVVRVAEVDTPTPGPGEIQVEVHASTVNRTDCGFRAAQPFIVRAVAGLRRPRRPILGTDFAGVVSEVAPDVDAFSVGDRVFGFDDTRFGGHGGFLTRRADAAIAAIPEGISFEEAAAVVEGTHYAEAFMRFAKLRPGHRIAVNGATGAIGVAAVQLAARTGAHVTAVCESEHADLVRSLGADTVIDRTTTDFTEGDARYDLVLDAVGKSTFGRSKRVLVPKGRYISSELGPKGMNPVLALVTPLLGGRSVRFPFPGKPTREEMQRMAELLATGELRAVIDRRYALDDVVEAYRYVESGRKIGSVVLDVAGRAPSDGGRQAP